MSVLRCTRKVLSEIGIRPADLPTEDSGATCVFGDWYVNLIQHRRRKCALFVNEPTLLSFFVIGVTRAELRDLPALFARGLRRTFEAEGWTDEEIDQILREHNTLVLGATKNRSTIGSMNDLALHYTWSIEADGGPDVCDLDSITRSANRTPQRPISWRYSIDPWNEIFASHAKPLTGRRLRLIEDLAARLRSGETAQVAMRYVDVIPGIFESLPRFMRACHENGLNCTTPPGLHSSIDDMMLHIRRDSLLTRVGLDVPFAN